MLSCNIPAAIYTPYIFLHKSWVLLYWLNIASHILTGLTVATCLVISAPLTGHASIASAAFGILILMLLSLLLQSQLAD